MTKQNLDTQLPVFHEGEIQMQKSIGAGKRLEELGKRMIRDNMPEQHRAFFAQLSTVHIGIIDTDGYPHALLRTGSPGFISSPDEYTLVITSKPMVGEPENLSFNEGSKISIVGLEFETRRRNRLNATITSHNGDELIMRVDQSYGNCPKYIQIRNLELKSTKPTSTLINKTSTLDQSARSIIQNTDTLFIASRTPVLDADPRAGVDINHRGGNPGFVEILDEKTVMFPDYKGNNFFNTYGNILLDDRVGLQFLDFQSSSVLNLKGSAEIITLEGEFNENPDMGRRIKITIKEVQITENLLPFEAEFIAWSPMLPDR